MTIGSLAVFCGSSTGRNPLFAQAARELGTLLGARGIALVYGGGRVGLMGILADAALEAGAHVLGVMPQALVDLEVAHKGLPDLRVVQSMHERKAIMADSADAFVALPGGFGTLEEFFEIVTWGQLGLHRKPLGLLNVAGFYDPLLALLDHAVEERLLRPENRAMIRVENNVKELLSRLEQERQPPAPKWLDRDET